MARKIKTRAFVEQCVKEGITSPALIASLLKERHKIEVSDNAITMVLKRTGINRKAIEETQKLEAQKDIIQHERVKAYLTAAQVAGTTQKTVNRQLQRLHYIYELMGRRAPEQWDYNNVMEAIKKDVPQGIDARGRMAFAMPAKVLTLLSTVNTFFPNVLPRGFGGGLTRTAGELKDYFTFEEFALFLSNATDTPHLSTEGWRTLFKTQVNLGCREGGDLTTGILSLKWEAINYTTMRTTLHDKGGKGKAAREWRNLPLNLFPWLNGFADLVAYHKQVFGYEPTNERHGTGRVFNIRYDEYRKEFHATRKKCNSRISGDVETMRPHVIRKTHAQWLVKLKVPMERICGQFPNGAFGVGWDSPLILLRYYVTLDESEEAEIYNRMTTQIEKLGIATQAAQ